MCATWAKRAEAAELHATARRFYERVIELDADHRIARGKLGYKRALGRWQRDKRIEHEVLARKDKDPKLAKILKKFEGRIEIEADGLF